MIKPLDFVTPIGDSSEIGIINEISSFNSSDTRIAWQASISWITKGNGLRNAWWLESELRVINNLPNLLSKNLAHPFGDGASYVDNIYPINKSNDNTKNST